jgi:hypothetical protein
MGCIYTRSRYALECFVSNPGIHLQGEMDVFLRLKEFTSLHIKERDDSQCSTNSNAYAMHLNVLLPLDIIHSGLQALDSTTLDVIHDVQVY